MGTRLLEEGTMQVACGTPHRSIQKRLGIRRRPLRLAREPEEIEAALLRINARRPQAKRLGPFRPFRDHHHDHPHAERTDRLIPVVPVGDRLLLKEI